MKLRRRSIAVTAAAVLAGLAASTALAAAPPAAGEICSDTTLSILPPPACIGSFVGGLDGSGDELGLLKSTWSLDFAYLGRSDEADFGPFATNPQVAFNGSLAFDQPHSGQFVLGLVSAGKHSHYFINSKRRVGGLVFDSLEGVATTPQGNPFALDYAALYVATSVPEPGAWALWSLGLSCVGVAGCVPVAFPSPDLPARFDEVRALGGTGCGRSGSRLHALPGGCSAAAPVGAVADRAHLPRVRARRASLPLGAVHRHHRATAGRRPTPGGPGRVRRPGPVCHLGVARAVPRGGARTQADSLPEPERRLA